MDKSDRSDGKHSGLYGTLLQCDGIHYLKKQLIMFLCVFLIGCGGVENLSESPSKKGEETVIEEREETEREYTPEFYTLSDFQKEELKAGYDYDGDGIDDFDDFLSGARKDAENHPVYDSAYVSGGYPPEDRGVCTDVIWRAFREAGYDLKEMVDRDIERDPGAYPRVAIPDPNIDFRRVPNQESFFKKYGESLTLDPKTPGEWQRGDIVVYGNRHIAMVSDRLNEQGEPWIVHNFGQRDREEDGIHWGEITGHYRFYGDRIPEEVKVRWK